LLIRVWILISDPIGHDPTGQIKEPSCIEEFLFPRCPACPENTLLVDVVYQFLSGLHIHAPLGFDATNTWILPVPGRLVNSSAVLESL
jgi:hypothetical protein